ncbi:hypothetical protein [Flavobacterium reichenbachii]|uniref:Uncharacterized protein n=1 Tax=Flavobacterium reichenbachii TaxID=362418 RepID=A0A085ZPA1_9FLAO|nr:hypothetical protein [Flavobacterium reichenbachii]KFF06265.1 hypothetical protein IW19_12310 [Flavobacterium reichenbachii]OXB17520.1 hypothetical protein B0A68_04290 [Flavobacterium reichenbachii]
MEKTLDTINIELKVYAVLSEPDNIWMQGDIEIFINGEKPYNEGDIIDSYILQESLIKNGSYFIFSCSCGIPQCSGWLKGINVTHTTNTITWEDLNHNKIWNFEKSKIEQDLKNINEEVKIFKQYFAGKKIEYVGCGYNL